MEKNKFYNFYQTMQIQLYFASAIIKFHTIKLFYCEDFYKYSINLTNEKFIN